MGDHVAHQGGQHWDSSSGCPSSDIPQLSRLDDQLPAVPDKFKNVVDGLKLHGEPDGYGSQSQNPVARGSESQSGEKSDDMPGQHSSGATDLPHIDLQALVEAVKNALAQDGDEEEIRASNLTQLNDMADKLQNAVEEVDTEVEMLMIVNQDESKVEEVEDAKEQVLKEIDESASEVSMQKELLGAAGPENPVIAMMNSIPEHGSGNLREAMHAGIRKAFPHAGADLLGGLLNNSDMIRGLFGEMSKAMESGTCPDLTAHWKTASTYRATYSNKEVTLYVDGERSGSRTVTERNARNFGPAVKKALLHLVQEDATKKELVGKQNDTNAAELEANLPSFHTWDADRAGGRHVTFKQTWGVCAKDLKHALPRHVKDVALQLATEREGKWWGANPAADSWAELKLAEHIKRSVFHEYQHTSTAQKAKEDEGKRVSELLEKMMVTAGKAFRKVRPIALLSQSCSRFFGGDAPALDDGGLMEVMNGFQQETVRKTAESLGALAKDKNITEEQKELLEANVPGECYHALNICGWAKMNANIMFEAESREMLRDFVRSQEGVFSSLCTGIKEVGFKQAIADIFSPSGVWQKVSDLKAKYKERAAARAAAKERCNEALQQFNETLASESAFEKMESDLVTQAQQFAQKLPKMQEEALKDLYRTLRRVFSEPEP